MKIITFDQSGYEYTGEALEYHKYVCKNVSDFDYFDFHRLYEEGKSKEEIAEILNEIDEEQREYCRRLDEDPEDKLIFDMSMNH